MTLLMRDQENLEKGINQERKKIVMKMIQQGFTIGQIMAVCEVTEEEIKRFVDNVE